MNSGGIFDLQQKKERLGGLNKLVQSPDFWQDPLQAKRSIQELNLLRRQIEPFLNIVHRFDDLKELAAISEGKDKDLVEDLVKDATELIQDIESLEFKVFLSGRNDIRPAIISIHAGAGGTEACDWAAMLLRMYTRWAEKKGYSLEVVDFLPGEEAGVKSMTAIISGDYAFGYLKNEIGVHRLVRISPFDANRRRHTSFASVDIIPEIEEDIEVDIKANDLKIDTYRASGPGGQHVNVTDSAVRITHLPSGIVVQCQSERSQYKNRQTALKVLKSRLYEQYKKEKLKKLEEDWDEKKEIAWGSQIRSYIFHPYSLVKDHRTKLEKGNVQAVMDGEIDSFIFAALKRKR